MINIENEKCLKDFGQYIREKREQKGFDQKDIASKLGITQSYYSMIERGDRNVDLVMALKICQILDLNMKKFISTYL